MRVIRSEPSEAVQTIGVGNVKIDHGDGPDGAGEAGGGGFVTIVTGDPLAMEAQKLAQLKSAAAVINEKVSDQQELVSQLMFDSGQKSVEFFGKRYTLVQAERVKFNESGLKKALGARVYNKLTTPKLDHDKLQTAIADGSLDATLVQQYAEIAKNKASVRISEAPNADQ